MSNMLNVRTECSSRRSYRHVFYAVFYSESMNSIWVAGNEIKQNGFI